MSYLTEYEEIDGGYVTFGRNPKGRKITGKVATDDYSRFTWVFFLATKDDTSGILKSFITRIENLVDHKVNVIRCDNGTEFKNREIDQFCKMKGILKQFSVARTSQQNKVAERRNRTLIEAARTMLADSKLPTTFRAEAVNTACYVQNRVLVVKLHNKIPYELFHGITPTLSFIRPFECPVTILNTLDHLGKFNGKADEGQARKETEPVKDYILLPLWTVDLPFLQDPTSSYDDGFKPSSDDGKKVDEVPNDAVADMNNLDTTIQVSHISTTRIHKDDPLNHVIGDLHSATQTRQMSKNLEEHGTQKGNSCIERSKLDRGYIGRASTTQVTRTRLVAQGYTREDGIDYDEVFAPVAIIKSIRLFLAYASFKDFVVYQMDVKNAFLYEKIEEEVYVCQPPGFEDPYFPDRVYKKKDGIFITQDKYVGDILKKFGFTEVKTASTQIETKKPLLKDEDGVEVDVHMY
nr:Gag-Pol polyprotein [Tanacetum cinerariifolium]